MAAAGRRLAVASGRVAAWLLLGWGWLHAIGGGLLSVLPLPLWPYQPEQSPRHYAVHALYGVLQAPLLIVLSQPEVARRVGQASAGAAAATMVAARALPAREQALVTSHHTTSPTTLEARCTGDRRCCNAAS